MRSPFSTVLGIKFPWRVRETQKTAEHRIHIDSERNILSLAHDLLQHEVEHEHHQLLTLYRVDAVVEHCSALFDQPPAGCKIPTDVCIGASPRSLMIAVVDESIWNVDSHFQPGDLQDEKVLAEQCDAFAPHLVPGRVLEEEVPVKDAHVAEEPHFVLQISRQQIQTG